MAEAESKSSGKSPSRWRRIFWMLASALVLTMLGKALFPELSSMGKERIALVRVEGAILDSQATVQDLETYGESPLVKAIVLRIDSPGGGVASSQEIYNAVKRLRSRYGKPVVASMGTVAASGGYYIAVAADRILANPGTLTGSIGVIMQLANFEELLKKIGVHSEVIKTGRFKDVGSPFRPMNEQDRELLESVMDDVHRQFIEAVAEGRSLDVADVESLSDGRIFTGQQAKDILLIDELGDLHDAIKVAADMSGVPQPPLIVEPSRRFSFRELLSNKIFGTASGIPSLSGVNLMYLMPL